MKKAAIIIALMTSLCLCADAQNVLKGLGDKAKQKVEKSVQKKIDQKIDQTIDGAVNRLFGDTKQNNGNQNDDSGSYTNTNAGSYGFGQGLLDDYGTGWAWDGDEDNLPLLPGNTLKDAIGFIPEIPAPEVLVTEQGWVEFDKTVKIASKATEALSAKLMVKISSYPASYGAYSGNEKLEKIFEELMAIQESQVNKMIAAQQTAATNMLGALTGNTQTLENGTLDGALATMSAKITKNWPRTEECRKINQMHSDKKNHKDLNATIDAYNAKQMKKWIETIRLYQEADKASVMRLVEIEGILNTMSESEKSDPFWNKCMVLILQQSSNVMSYALYPSYALNCPMVRHVE